MIYYCERYNKFKQAYSFAKSLKTSFWSKEAEEKHGYRNGVTAEVSPYELVRNLYDILKDIEYYNEHLQSMTSKEYYFEDLIQDQALAATREICRDFGVEPKKVTYIPMKKQSTPRDEKQLRQIIKNLTVHQPHRS